MAIRTVHLPDGTDIVIDEWLHWPLFSTLELDNAVGLDLRCFTYVVGQRVPRNGTIAARNATDADTNMSVRGRINHDEAFVCFSITYEPFALDSFTTGSPAQNFAVAPMIHSRNLRILQREVVVGLYVGAGIRKPQFRAPFSYVGQGPGAPAWGTGDAVDAAAIVRPSYGTGGRPTPNNQRRFNLPIFIESDRTMYFHARSPNGVMANLSQDIRLRFYLDGIKRRPVA
ncbi:MAG: hypothetical protein JSV86_05420 [Gemmatimonadota bacterium]|nr:MAG: hypothetical protein JSV86_05420 [Gemmatimonadota bacterium]